jgi:hypothetical protein
MSSKVLEIKASNGIKNSPDNSFFQTVYCEPITLKAGSSIDMKTAFIDIGNQSIGLIEVRTNIQLGIEFYRYEYDIAQVPNTSPASSFYAKRYIYSPSDADYTNFLPGQPPSPTIPKSTYGYRVAKYTNSNLPAFLLERTNSVIVGNSRTETFRPTKETATINLRKGLYTKQKLIQQINDQFNLIVGSLTNADKPNEVITPATPPHQPSDARTPLDYNLPTNYTGNLLKAYTYDYVSASEQGNDPLQNPIFPTPIVIYKNDINWNYWFFPIYTEPNPPTYYYNKDEYWLPYVWYANGQQGFMAGASKFNVEYDPDNDEFFIDYTHTPIISNQGKEVVVFSDSNAFYQLNETSAKPESKIIGYKANGSMGGILLSRLFSYECDDNFNVVSQTNTGFWQIQMGFGFDDASSAQFEADFVQEQRIYYQNAFFADDVYATATYTVFNITYPNPKYLLTNCTDSLIPIQWLVQSNYTIPAQDYGMSIFSKDLPKVFESIGTRPIYPERGTQSAQQSPYFLIEVNINHIKNDNFRDQDSYRQIMLIAGRTYGSGTQFIQTFDDGNIQALNLETDISIDRVEVKILNPDKTLAQGLGDGTTIYLNLTEPIIVQK